MDGTTLAKVVQLIDQLTPAEKQALREHLNQIDSPDEGAPEERIAKLNEAIDAMREGLTSQQLDELEWAMNYEFIAEADEE
jgi:hypothetical protein